MPREKKVFHFNGVSLSLYHPQDLSKRWYLEYYDGPNRKKRSGNINRFDTWKGRMEAAEAFARELSLELVDLQDHSIRELILFAENLSGTFRKRSTHVNVMSIVRKFTEWMGPRPISRTNTEEFFEHLIKHRHGTTYNQYRYWLKRLFEELKIFGCFTHIKSLKNVRKTPQRFFQPHQVKHLHNYIVENDPQLWHYIEFIFYCAIRPRRELPWIKAGDVLLEERKILIEGEHSKNGKTQYVSIPDTFFASLEYVYDKAPGEYLFTQRWAKDKPIGRNTMGERFKNIIDELQFGPRYSLYSWKHTAAFRMVKAGISLKYIQKHFRHSSLMETDQYLRQIGIEDIGDLRQVYPSILQEKSPAEARLQ